MITFLLADDHSMIRQGMEFMIEDIEINHKTTHASSLAQVQEKLKEEAIDFLIIDAHFPDGNSLSIIPNLKNLYPELKILVFSGLEESQYALRFLNAGVNGFLSKLSEEDEIKSALLKVLNEGRYVSQFSQNLLLNSLSNKNSQDPLQTLSERELEIAKLYAKGLGNLEIANQLDIKQNTVSTVKKRIFDKLQIDNIVELVELFKDYS